MLSFPGNGQKRPLASIQQRWLPEESGVDAVQRELALDGELGDDELLGGDSIHTAEIVDQFIPPLEQGPSDLGFGGLSPLHQVWKALL